MSMIAWRFFCPTFEYPVRLCKQINFSFSHLLSEWCGLICRVSVHDVVFSFDLIVRSVLTDPQRGLL